jgi:hypothetical protein
MEAQAMKETDVDTFSLTLTRLTCEANKDFIMCKELQAYLDENADLLEKTSHTLVYAIARTLVNQVAGVNWREDLRGYGSAEVVHREYKNILAGLLGDDSNMMIRLLAERAALCWLHVQAAEKHHNELNGRASIQYRHLEFAEKRLTAAQNRFLRACTALAKARAMITATEIMRERQPAKPRLALVARQ